MEKKELQGKPLTSAVDDIISAKKSTVLCRAEGGEPIVICGEDFAVENQIIVPVINNGDCFGTVILYDKEKGNKFDSSDVKIVQLAAMVLSKQFE